VSTKVKTERSTKLSSVGIKYSLCDVICDVINYCASSCAVGKSKYRPMIKS